MKEAKHLGDYLTTTFLVALFAAVGVSAAITIVLAAWPPLAKLAAILFG